MKTVGDVFASPEEKRILASILPGGDKWAFSVKNGDKCREDCPAYRSCRGHGPDKICSDSWSKSPLTPLVLDVMAHTFSHFDYYNKGDLSDITEKNEKVNILREKISKLYTQIENEEIEEGTLTLRTHYFRERDTDVAKKLKEKAFNEDRLICAACEVDFKARLGALGIRVIECHHTVPLSSLRHTGKTQLADLALVCANCHRLAHSQKEPLTIQAIRSLHNNS